MSKAVGLKITALLFLSLLVIGCSSTPQKQSGPHISKMQIPTRGAKPLGQKQSAIYKKLNKQYQRWRGTPYELGSMDRSGIDCSGFVHVTFRDAFGMKIPRSTESLAKRGNRINKNQLKVGDLVFFKTGRKIKHVGIYVGNQHFIHASTSRGVMKSNLRNPYWRKHYWKSTRLLAN